MCILFHPFLRWLIFSPAIGQSFPNEWLRGSRLHWAWVSLPLTTQSFCHFEPSSFNSPLLHFALLFPFSVVGLVIFLLLRFIPPPSLLLPTQPCYPCQIHWGSSGEVNMEPIDCLHPGCYSSVRNANTAETTTSQNQYVRYALGKIIFLEEKQ